MSTVQIIEFFLGLLIAASLVALVTSRLRIPYTVALVVAGFAIDLFHFPIMALFEPGAGPEHLLTPEIIFTLFLPALLFEAGINIHVRHLRENLAPIFLLSVAGVLVATAVTGLAVYAFVGLPLLVALLFGALISATDPISVLALFRDMGVAKRLSVVVEGESLFNDGTAVVVFQILLAALVTGHVSVASGVGRFLAVAAGGAALGLVLGYVASRIHERVDDPRIEITLTTILAYGAYLLAEHLHVSGVIATVAAGLMVGNFGAEIGMTARTRVSLWSFWEYVAFVINSLVFLLIGIEVHVVDLLGAWKAIGLGIVAVLAGRALTVYALTPLSNLVTEKIPLPWQHVLVWGGLHGSVSMALALSLGAEFPHRQTLLAMTFGVVAFSIIVQGLTVKPLVRALGIESAGENAYDRAKVRQMALAAAAAELETMQKDNLISRPLYESFRADLQAREEGTVLELKALLAKDPALSSEERKMAHARLLAAEKAAVTRATSQGVILQETADRLVMDLDRQLEDLRPSPPRGKRS